MRDAGISTMLKTVIKGRLITFAFFFIWSLVLLKSSDKLTFYFGIFVVVSDIGFCLWLLRAVFSPESSVKKCGTDETRGILVHALEEECVLGKTIYQDHYSLFGQNLLFTENYIAAASSSLTIIPVKSVLWVNHRRRYRHRRYGSRFHYYLIFFIKETGRKPVRKFEISFSEEDEAFRIMGILKDHFCFPVGENYELKQLYETDYNDFETRYEQIIKANAEIKSRNRTNS